MSSNSKRNIYLDKMRGIATLLVIFGHCFQTAYVNYPNLLLYQFIYLFHVPLFALVSGYLLEAREKVSFSFFALDRFKRLFIPYIIWASVIAWIYNDALLINSPLQFYERGVLSIQTPWFLYILFLSSLIFFLINKIKTKIVIYCLAIGVVVVNMYSRTLTAEPLTSFIVKTLYYTLIVGLGYYIQKVTINKSYLKLLFVFAITSLFIYFSLNADLRKSHFLFPLEFINTLLGIYVVFFIVYKVRNYLFTAGITWLGIHALEVYVIHYLFIILIPYAHNNFLILVVSFIGVTTACILVITLRENIISLYPRTRNIFSVIFGS